MINFTILLFVILFSGIVSLCQFKKVLTPVSGVLYLWSALSLVIIMGLTKLPLFTVHSFLVISIGMLGFTAGCVIHIFLRQKKSQLTNRPPPNYKKLTGLILISVPLLSYGFLFFVNKVLSVGLDGYLMETKWIGEQTQIFSGRLGYSFATVLIKGFLYASFFYSLAIYFVTGRKRYLVLTSIMLLIYSIVLFSRIEMLIVLLSFFVAYCLVRKKSFGFYVKFSILCFLAVSLLFTFTYIRSGGESNLLDMLSQYVVNYHLYGLTIFALTIDESIVVDGINRSYGLLTFPIISFFPEQLLSIFLGERYIFPATEARGLMQEMVTINLTDGNTLKTNAFYTSFYLFYNDFGVLGVFFIPALYGFSFSRAYESWLINNSTIDLTFVLFWCYTGYTALFFPPQIAEYYWFCLLSLFFFKLRFVIKR